MKRMNLVLFSIFVLLIVFIIYSVSAVQNDTQVMTVEADVLAGPGQIVKIQVPDYLFLGDVRKGEESNESKVIINNTGNVDVIVKPELINPNDEIFENLQLRKRKTGNSSTSYPIGEFTINVTKPASEGGVNDEYFYIRLDLTNYDGDIDSDQIGRQADIRFIAMAA